MSLLVKLDPAKPSDLPELIELLAEYYAYDGLKLDRKKARSALRTLMADSTLGHVWFLEASPGGRAGYAIICFGYSIEFGGKYAFLDEIYLSPNWRSLGLGSQAIAKIASYCRRSGAKAIRLEVERSNRKAHRLYRRRLFKAHDRDLMTRPL